MLISRCRVVLSRIVFLAMLWGVIGPAVAEDAPRPFSHPDRIRYDGQCLTIDGKDVFIFSGSFHYFRCPKELWPERFRAIKAAGFNCVDTYVPWNVSEIGAPKDLNDFSQVNLRDLEDWLNLAEKSGLYVIVRPGPFICAEWNRGGFPGWLETKRPVGYDEWSWFRSNDPTYIAWARHWYRALLPTIVKHQITRKASGQPGVILVFLENEYDHYFKDKQRGEITIKALAEEAMAQGIDVPLVTCETDCVDGNQNPLLRHVFNVRNFYPGWNISQMADQLEKQHRVQPDAPLMIGEAQGGWFSFAWTVPPIKPDQDYYREDQTPAQISNLTLFAIQNGVTGLNYYMLFGGTNPGDNSAKDMATSYDFNAPIRECGGVGEKYARVAALGAMLREHGASLARSRIVEAKTSTDQPDVTVVMRQSPDGGRYLFVRTDQHTEPRSGVAQVQPGNSEKEIVFNYQLEPLGSKILYLQPGCNDAAAGEWLPKPLPPVARPANLPGPIELSQMLCREDPGPKKWKKLPAGSSLNDVGIYDNRFVFYRANFVLNEKELNGQAGLRARFDYPTLAAGSRAAGHGISDHVSVLLNGRLVGEAEPVSGDVSLPPGDLQAGTNEMLFLYQNAGCLKEDDWMEKEAGVRGVRLLPANPADELISGWKMKVVNGALTNGLNLNEATVEGKDIEIDKPVADQISHGQTALFWTGFELTQEDIRTGRTGLFLSQVGDYAQVFVNGKEIGQSHCKTVSHTFDMADAVVSGSNSLAVVVSSVDELGHGGMGLAKLTWPESAGIRPTGGLEYSDRFAGLKWNGTSVAETSWQSRPVPDQSPASDALLRWYRLPFQLPVVANNTWVPWLVRLKAAGDGFIYLNGHLVGRYFQDGAQHDYYLPECWLNAAPGAKNVISTCLRDRGDGTAIQSAEIRPYSVYAEVR